MKTLQQIDYTPLQELDAAWTKVMRDTFKLPPMITIGIGVALAIVAVYYLGYVSFFIISAVTAAVGQRVHTKKNIAWKNFAVANGWYVMPILQSDIRFIPPGLWHLRSKPKMSLVVHASFEGHECDLFMYQFSSGGRRDRKVHNFTIARVILPRPFPHLIVDSKQTWAINHRGTATAKVRLEGDFDKYFSLYFNPGSHIDALSIVTPDIMRTLIDFNQRQDIEVVDNNLFFIMNHDGRGPKDLPKLLAAVDALADEFIHKAKTIHYAPEGPPGLTALKGAALQHFQSGDMVMNSLSGVFLVVVLLPFIFFLFVSLLTFFVP